MKFFIVLLAVFATAIASPINPVGLAIGAGVAHVRNDVALAKSAYNLLADGTYNYNYDTGSIVASENGVGGQFAKGTVEYTSPEGEHISLQYTADENGYQPSGSHVIPTPDYILRSLEYIKAHPNPKYQR